MPTIDLRLTGMNIKNIMHRAGFKTTDIQRAFGFSTPQAIYKWFRGDALPTVDNLVILAHLFDCTVDDLLVLSEVNSAVA